MDTDFLDRPIFQIGSGGIPWTIRNSFEGVQIFGGIGSGKTSGSGRFLALKFLSQGYGGLVLTAKPDEKNDWVEYCKATNRLDDLVIVEPKGAHYFNFLDYESRSSEDQKSYTENIVQVLKTVIRASEEKETGKSNDPFWDTALDMLISNTIDLCLFAYGKVTIELMYEIARAASKAGQKKAQENIENKEEKPNILKAALDLANQNIKKKISKACIEINSRYNIEELSKFTPEEYDNLIAENVPESRTLLFVLDFFHETYVNLSEKTRAIIDFSFTGFLFRLLKDPVYSLFCNKPSTFTPEDCLNSKIIIINLPVKLYHKVGRDIQIMFKYIWQRAMEKRDIKKNGRPVFLWADEAQNFLHEYDPDYQATARSSRIATVYISQNIPNYYANMGGTKAEHKVKSFLGTLATKIFHANADIETNKYASDLIGEAYQKDESESIAVTDGKTTVTTNTSSKLVKIVRPEKFHTLQTGGSKNNYKVTGYIHVQGLKLLNGFSYDGVKFDQTKI